MLLAADRLPAVRSKLGVPGGQPENRPRRQVQVTVSHLSGWRL